MGVPTLELFGTEKLDYVVALSQQILLSCVVMKQTVANH